MSQVLARFCAALPRSVDVETSRRVLERRAHDISYHTPVTPLAVAIPSCEADIVAIMKAAHELRIPVIPISGRTSLEGHIIASKDNAVILIDTASKMDKVIAVHENDLDVVVQPGVGWMDLKEKLEPLGLFFPPDPGASACIGGMCGTNCSGTLAFRYGTMKDNVMSLRVVLADGTVVTTRRRPVKSSAGYDLTRLFVGSEGTLGIISEITLRLRVHPPFSSVAMSQFQTLEAAAHAVQSLVRKGIPFHRLEIMDDVCVRAVNNGISRPHQRFPELTTLLAECAGFNQVEVDSQIDMFRQVCEEASKAAGQAHGSVTVATNEDEKERLWSVRKRAFFAATSLREGVECGVLTTDVAVPVSRLVESLADAKKLLGEMGLVGPIVAHAGDGNYHVLVAIRNGDAKEIESAEHFRDIIARRAIAMGGSCTGEHGIGKGKRHLLVEEVGPEAMAVMKLIKKALDPNNILNPGNIFLEGETKPKL